MSKRINSPLVDDELALKVVDYQIKSGNKRGIPRELENKVTIEQVHALQHPYRDNAGRMNNQAFRHLRTDILNRLETKRRERREQALFFLQIIIVVATILMAKATIDSANSAAELIKQERKFNAPMLSFWQDKRSGIPMPVTSDLISQEEIKHYSAGFCLRNDGRTSTGSVFVYPLEEGNFTFYEYRIDKGSWHYPVFPNIPSGEGNCTDIFIWYKPCLDNLYCNSSNVPKGINKIQLKLRCALCEEQEREVIKELTICVRPSEECE